MFHSECPSATCLEWGGGNLMTARVSMLLKSRASLTHRNVICHAGSLTACEQDQDGTVCTVKNCWWWTEKLSETCRILFQKQIWEISASGWFYYKNLARCMFWRMPLLCVRWRTPGDGQRNCPKHVEFYSKNKFEKLVLLVGFVIRIYRDARSA